MLSMYAGTAIPRSRPGSTVYVLFHHGPLKDKYITASIFVNDHESGLWQDIMAWLEDLAPRKPEYKHHFTGEDNADAHLKRMLLGHQVIVPVTDGKLDLGTWERVHYGEFDGQRPKRILFKAVGIGDA